LATETQLAEIQAARYSAQAPQLTSHASEWDSRAPNTRLPIPSTLEIAWNDVCEAVYQVAPDGLMVDRHAAVPPPAPAPPHREAGNRVERDFRGEFASARSGCWNHNRRFEPRDGCGIESAATRRGSERVPSGSRFPARSAGGGTAA
jgi:hypothetical protein